MLKFDPKKTKSLLSYKKESTPLSFPFTIFHLILNLHSISIPLSISSSFLISSLLFSPTLPFLSSLAITFPSTRIFLNDRRPANNSLKRITEGDRAHHIHESPTIPPPIEHGQWPLHSRKIATLLPGATPDKRTWDGVSVRVVPRSNWNNSAVMLLIFCTEYNVWTTFPSRKLFSPPPPCPLTNQPTRTKWTINS